MSVQEHENKVIAQLLKDSKTIAIVGLSNNPDKISYIVAQYIQAKGFKIIPVNPVVTGKILGEEVYASLADIPDAVDIVNVFRKPEYTPEIAQEAVNIGAKALWLQLGISNQEAAQIATDHGLTVIMNRCIKVEAARYL